MKLPSPDDVRTPVEYGFLVYSNPYRQIVHPRWANGEVVYSFPLGRVAIDPRKTKVAEEYSPIWHHHYVIVPRDFVPQMLRSEADVVTSGYEIRSTDIYTN